jgi:hypothetical protein
MIGAALLGSFAGGSTARDLTAREERSISIALRAAWDGPVLRGGLSTGSSSGSSRNG